MGARWALGEPGEWKRRAAGGGGKRGTRACHGTEQTRASRAYDGAGAHLRLEDKHRQLYKLVGYSR